MAKKKTEKKVEPKAGEDVLEYDDAVTEDMTAEELKALEAEPEDESKEDKEEKDDADKGDDAKGSEDGDEDKKKKGDKEDDKKGKDKDVSKDDDGDKAGEKDGDKEDPEKYGEEVVLRVGDEKLKGFKSKSGTYVIDYSEVEKRDEARRVLRAENEGLKTVAETTKAQLDALTTQVEQLKAGKVETIPEGEVDTKIDFKDIAKKLYTSEDDAAEALEQVFNAGVKAGQVKAGVKEEGSEEQTPVKETLTPEQIKHRAEQQVTFKLGIEKILAGNEKLKDPKIEYMVTQLGMRKIGEKCKDLDTAAQEAYVKDPENLLAAIQEAVDETIELIGGTPESEEEKKTWREEERKRILDDVAGKLNLKEDEIRTLGDVGTSATDAELDPTKELDEKSGADLEEAMEGMSAEERVKYLDESK